MPACAHARRLRLKLLILVCWLAFSMITLTIGIGPLVPLIREDFGVSYTAMGFLFPTPALMSALFAMLGGSIVDRLGEWRAIAIGSLVFVLAGALRATAGSFGMLLIWTAVLGAGFGLTWPTLPKLVRAQFAGSIGRATAAYTGSFALGSMVVLGSTRSLVLPLVGSWRGAIVFWSALAALPGLIWWIGAKGLWKELEPAKAAPGKGPPLPPPRAPRRAVFRNPRVWLAAVVFFPQIAGFQLLTGWLTTLLLERGLTNLQVDGINALFGFSGLVTLVTFPWLSDRAASRKPFMFWATALMGLGFLTMPFASTAVFVPLLAITMSANSVGWGVGLTLPAEIVPYAEVGRASGILIAVGHFGGFLAPLAAGFLRDVTGGFAAGLLFMGAVSLITVALSLGLPGPLWFRFRAL